MKRPMIKNSLVEKYYEKLKKYLIYMRNYVLIVIKIRLYDD